MNTINTLSPVYSQNVVLKQHYLFPGTLFADIEPYEITTVLGSCVAVCLWDQERHIGGMNHYLLPQGNHLSEKSLRYGDIAIAALIDSMSKLGSRRIDIIAKIFGGGAVLEVISSKVSVGTKNIQFAREYLKHEKIQIVSNDVGGKLGRKIKFNTNTGIVSVKLLQKTAFVNSYIAETD